MDINWKLPFEILVELFLFVLGWTLVALVGLTAIAIVFGLIRGTNEIFTKNRKEKKAKTVEEPLQPMLGVIEPADNLSAIQLKKLLERGTD
jgi:hypothetical protein